MTSSTSPPSPGLAPATDPTRCPLCGGPNACAMEAAQASGQSQPPCWCTRLSFPHHLLARLPTEAQGVACICEACVRKALADDARAG